MRKAWRVLHVYAFNDINIQLGFLLVTALPQLIIQNNSLPSCEKNFLWQKLEKARNVLSTNFYSFKEKISQQFAAHKSLGNLFKPSHIIMDYLSVVRARFEQIDWFKFPGEAISKIEQVSRCIRFKKLIPRLLPVNFSIDNSPPPNFCFFNLQRSLAGHELSISLNVYSSDLLFVFSIFHRFITMVLIHISSSRENLKYI